MTLIYIAVAISSAIMFFLFIILPAYSQHEVRRVSKRANRSVSRMAASTKIFVEKENLTS